MSGILEHGYCLIEFGTAGAWARGYPRAGQKVLTVLGVMLRDADFKQHLCADIDGFSLHAAVRCGADDRQAPEQYCPHITHPALANERVRTNAAGQVVLKLKAPWRGGATHLAISPPEFMQRLLALDPRQRLQAFWVGSSPLNGSFVPTSLTAYSAALGRSQGPLTRPLGPTYRSAGPEIPVCEAQLPADRRLEAPAIDSLLTVVASQPTAARKPSPCAKAQGLVPVLVW
jgi:hypothetical protein